MPRNDKTRFITPIPLLTINFNEKKPQFNQKKNFSLFLLLYSKYTVIYCNRSIFSTSTPSGCIQHVKIPLLPNFGALFRQLTLKVLTAWTILPKSVSKPNCGI